MHAEIVVTGDEILSGEILDTNTQWLSHRLEELGIRVRFHGAVGDELEPMVEVFRQAIARSDVVVVTGGLGPTPADLTREAIAKATGQELVFNPQAMEHIRQLFARRRREMPPRNERQAWFPAGSRMIHNPNGTAPGIEMEVPRKGASPCHLFALPGVPGEMKEMWHGSVAEALRRAGGGQNILCHKQIKCFGAGESQIEAMLPDLIRRGRVPRVGITASDTTIILRITAEGPSEEACAVAMAPTIATIRQCLGNLIFGEDEDELQDAVLRLLRQKKKTLAAAEWGTKGLVNQWLAGAAGAEGSYLGGLTVASEPALTSALGVWPEVLAQHSAASGEVVGAMAAGCRQRFAADYGLAVGRAPDFDPQAPAPQPIVFALATAGGVDVKSFPYAGHPATLNVFCAKRALNLVRLALL